MPSPHRSPEPARYRRANACPVAAAGAGLVRAGGGPRWLLLIWGRGYPLPAMAAQCLPETGPGRTGGGWKAPWPRVSPSIFCCRDCPNSSSARPWLPMAAWRWPPLSGQPWLDFLERCTTSPLFCRRKRKAACPLFVCSQNVCRRPESGAGPGPVPGGTGVAGRPPRHCREHP